MTKRNGKAPKNIASIKDLQPDAANVNKGSERGAAILEHSLSHYGAGRSLLADAEGVVIAGNKTLQAAADLDLPVRVVQTDGKELVVVQRTDLHLSDGGAARALAIADNRASELGYVPDIEQLLLHAQQVDVSAMYSKVEIDELMRSAGQGISDVDAEPQIDRAEELREKWQTERGQVWQLGAHRLMCGDSTSAEDVARLMGGDKCVLLSTDPPYGVDYEGAKYNPRAKAWRGIDGDKRQGEDLRSWLSGLLKTWLHHCDDDLAVYLWTAAMQEGAAAAAAAADAGIHIQSQIIWNKNTLILGQADYQWKHENCWYGFIKGKHHRWFGGRAQTTVWDVSKIANSAYEHPMQKPTELYAVAIKNHTVEGETCAEPFSGSGSQIIACEQLTRKCRAMEIAPEYVAVALQRWADATGKTPVLIT